VWVVRTKSSSYIIDYVNKQFKRTAKETNPLMKDDEWVDFAQISFQQGEPMEIIVRDLSDDKPYGYRVTTPVVSTMRVQRNVISHLNK